MCVPSSFPCFGAGAEGLLISERAVDMLPSARPHSVNSKHNSQLDYAARLARLGSEAAEGKSGSDIAGADVRYVGASEDLLVLVGRCQRERPRRAARSVQQVGGVGSCVPAAPDVFPASGERESFLQDASSENRSTPRR